MHMLAPVDEALDLTSRADLDLKAPLASPALTGTPTSTTAAANTNTTQIATTAFVVGQAGTVVGAADGTAAVGTSLRYAREDHVHPAPASGITRVISQITSSTTALAAANTDYVYVCATALTLTMPTASGNKNMYTIKRTGTGNVIIATTSSQTIDGATSFTLGVQYESIDLVCDGISNWVIV